MILNYLSFSNSTKGVYTLLTTLTQAKGITFYHSITDRVKDNICYRFSKFPALSTLPSKCSIPAASMNQL